MDEHSNSLTSTATATTDTSTATVFSMSKRATPSNSITLAAIPTYAASRAAFKIGRIGTTGIGASTSESIRHISNLGTTALTSREVNSSLGSTGEVEYNQVTAKAGAGFVRTEHAHLFLLGSIASCVVGVSVMLIWRHARRRDKIHPEGLGIMPGGHEEGNRRMPHVLRPAVISESLAALPVHAWCGSGIV